MRFPVASASLSSSPRKNDCAIFKKDGSAFIAGVKRIGNVPCLLRARCSLAFSKGRDSRTIPGGGAPQEDFAQKNIIEENVMKPKGLALFALAALLAAPAAAFAQAPTAPNPPLSPRQEPARSIPVPYADISPGMQAFIAKPLNPDWNDQWQTGAEARAYANKQAAGVLPAIPGMLSRLHVTMTSATMGGVHVYVLTPDTIPPQNKDKVLIHVHGGCYVLFPGESGTTEGIMMAGFGHYKVISVDYRMPPEAYFPAALDDAVTVYKEVLKTTPAKNVAFFGTSAGGALTLEMVLRARQDGLPVPGAIAPATPMSDVTKTGDSFYTNEKVDNVLVSRDGFCQAATIVYAQGHDLGDPLLSPVYGDMHGFPPAILTTGTRDLLLSNTVRVHRKLLRSGVEAVLEVFEGESHAQYQFDDTLPETKEAFTEIGDFFGQHLGH
jgi:acetyl esterase/lipase